MSSPSPLKTCIGGGSERAPYLSCSTIIYRCRRVGVDGAVGQLCVDMCWGGDVWAGRAACLGIEEAICVDWVGRSVRLMGWWLERVGEVDRLGRLGGGDLGRIFT